jgi:hypothetical protein
MYMNFQSINSISMRSEACRKDKFAKDSAAAANEKLNNKMESFEKHSVQFLQVQSELKALAEDNTLRALSWAIQLVMIMVTARPQRRRTTFPHPTLQPLSPKVQLNYAQKWSRF